MARFLKIALVYVLVAGAIGLPILFRVWLLPAWRDLPQPEKFSLFMLLEDTRYAPGFSESSFSRLGIGMNKREVIRILGEPLSIVRRSESRVMEMMEMMEWGDGAWKTTYQARGLNASEKLASETYHYSRAGKASDHWYVRAVTFSSDGRVIRIRKTFYED